VITRRRQVLQELVAAGMLPRVTSWRPVVVGWLLAATVLTWKADDVHDPGGRAALLRIVAVLLAMGVVNLVDDPAANLLAAVPMPLAWRRGFRAGLAAAAVAAPWAAALLWVHPGRIAAMLTLECAAITAVGLAVASGLARWWSAREAGLAAGPAVLGTAVFTALLPGRWAMFTTPGSDTWNETHLRWAAVLGLASAMLLVTLRDPAQRKVTHRPVRSLGGKDCRASGSRICAPRYPGDHA
jgi:hypothetical protein